MAVFAPIPLPGTGFEGVAQGNELLNKMLMAPVERRHKAAQAEQAQADAFKSKMLMSLLGQATGTQTPFDQQAGVNQPQGLPGEQPSSLNQENKMGFSARELIRAMLGLPAETPSEAGARRVGEFKTEHELQTNLKAGEDIEDTAAEMNKTLSQVNRAKEILSRRPDLFQNMAQNKIKGALTKFGWSTDPDMNALLGIFGDLQTAKARLASTRGGAQVMNQVKEFKPDVMKQGAANLALLDEMAKDWGGQFEMLHHRYNKKTGKNLSDALGIGDSGQYQQSAPTGSNEKSSSSQKKFVTLYKGNQKYNIPEDEVEEALKSSEGFTREPK